MNPDKDSAAEFFDRLKKMAPTYYDLVTADTEEEFEEAFIPILEKSVLHLEKNKVNFASLAEEGLSAALAGSMTMPGLIVTQETHSNGHVDLTIEFQCCTPARTKLGEAKIYDGPSYHIKGMGQLLGRYTTGREMPGLMISYVRKKNIKGITEKLRTELDKQLPEKQIGPCADHKLKWSFVSKHEHDSGETVSVSHVGCKLF